MGYDKTIGVMVRDIENQLDAPGIIVLNLLDRILELDRDNRYVLFYRSDTFLDRYAHHPHVKSVVVKASGKLLWDQIAIPRAARREGVDILFHPKHTIPLLWRGKSLMHLRGAEQWVSPHCYEPLDRLYLRHAIPRFARKATRLVAESWTVKEEFERNIRGIRGKLDVIYLAPAPRFQQPVDPDRIRRVREKYALPERYAFTVTRLRQGKLRYPTKNLDNMVEAWCASEAGREMPFVIAGGHTREYVEEVRRRNPACGERLVGLGFVEQPDLPALYSQAEMLLFVSRYESFGIPILEAMATGCPVITANVYACSEISGGRAPLVHPDDTEGLTREIDRLASDPALRQELARRGREWVKRFSWERAARETIRILEEL